MPLLGQIYTKNCMNRKAVHAYCQLAMYSPEYSSHSSDVHRLFINWHIQDGYVCMIIIIITIYQ